MKFIYIIPFLLVFNQAFAECKLKNDEFIFKSNYNESDTVFSYLIARSDKKEINYYAYTRALGFAFNIKEDIRVSTDEKWKNYYMFYGYDENFYSLDLAGPQSQAVSSPLDKNNFKTTHTLKNEQNIEKLINYIRNENIRRNQPALMPFGKHDIYFKIKYILDDKVENCIYYKTEVINYDFGNEYIYKSKKWLVEWLKIEDWWSPLKEKTKQTWEAIIE